MILKDGDKVTLDGVEMEITHAGPSGYWLKEASGVGSYYTFVLKTRQELEDLHVKGRLVFGPPEKIKEGNTNCAHWEWKKYVGIREIYDYCTHCGAKKFKDWRLIKDDKQY